MAARMPPDAFASGPRHAARYSAVWNGAKVRPGTASAHSGRGHSIDLRAAAAARALFLHVLTPDRYNGACSHRSAASKFTRRVQSNTGGRSLRYIALVYGVLNVMQLT